MIDFPRSKNGHIDDGSSVRGTEGKRCPNCGSSNYRETVSTESCSDCGISCDYWGGGSNEEYDKMTDKTALRREEEMERRLDELFGED